MCHYISLYQDIWFTDYLAGKLQIDCLKWSGQASINTRKHIYIRKKKTNKKSVYLNTFCLEHETYQVQREQDPGWAGNDEGDGGGRGASPEERRKMGQKIKGGGENERLRRQRRKEGKMRRDAVRLGKGEDRVRGRREETVPASRTRSQPAAMAGDALQSPGPGEWNPAVQVVALRAHVTARSATTSSKPRARDLSLKETAAGWGEEGLSGGRGASSFCLSEDASIKPSSCLRSSCSVLASLALRSRFYKNMFSRVNSAQLTFLLSHLNSYFRSSRSFCFHTLAARTIFSEYRRGEERAALPSWRAQKKNPDEVCAAPWEYPASSVVASRGRFPELGLVCWWQRSCCGHLREQRGLPPSRGVGLQHGAVFIQGGIGN